MSSPLIPLLTAALLLTAAPTLLRAAEPASSPKTLAAQTDGPDMQWFNDARFGIFVHWGLYAIPAGEYTDPKTGKLTTNHGEWYLETTKMPLSEYDKFIPRFEAKNFDADAWVKAAADAGAKYLVFTSRHHDGFAMFPSETTPERDIRKTPFGKDGRDPILELKRACEKYGVRFCLYHTILDWSNPDYPERRAYNDAPGMSRPADMRKFLDATKANVGEVLRKYRPGILWLDGSWESPWKPEHARELLAHIRAIDPNVIVNDRVGPGAAGLGGIGKGEPFGDYVTPEKMVPGAEDSAGRPWETCMTMNTHWGFNKADKNWKSPETLIRMIAQSAANGGNFLLNLGPDADGVVPADSLKNLAVVGKWMRVNGESIHGTTRSPFKKTFDWGHVSAKGDTLYLHVFKRPADGVIVIPGDIRSARLLADGAPLKTDTVVGNTTDGAPKLTRITLPETLPDAIDTVIKVAR